MLVHLNVAQNTMFFHALLIVLIFFIPNYRKSQQAPFGDVVYYDLYLSTGGIGNLITSKPISRLEIS
jgi:hypothetical protein